MPCIDTLATTMAPGPGAGNVPTLTGAGIDVCCLANNHSLDWGPEGLLETLDSLHTAGGSIERAGCCGATGVQSQHQLVQQGSTAGSELTV
jgi:poly-gamma-glutamate synthesis protein (capsule biosynthesis protein)